ncbi:MAG: hypothetical protein V1765_03420 [bacterium]
MKLKFVVKSIEQEIVVLADNDQAVVWPKSKLPDNLREGQAIYFDIKENDNEDNMITTKELSPVMLLNDILKI